MPSFVDNLEKWVNQQNKKSKAKRLDALTVEFLAVKNDVILAVAAGYSIKTIWLFLKERGKVQSSYETFRRNVNRFCAPHATADIIEYNTEDPAQIFVTAAKMGKTEKKN
ncbi:MAG: TraK family protein [Enterovibrio sp.]